jgi:glycosyltransferase involved in cell wall biosynthesis
MVRLDPAHSVGLSGGADREAVEEQRAPAFGRISSESLAEYQPTSRNLRRVRKEAHDGNLPEIDILFLNWRDLEHPEGGGSEKYVHRVAEGLAERGLRVTLFCAAHDRAATRDEVVGGVRVIRRGGRFGVYLRGLAYVRKHRPAVVVDVQNGVPFASALVARCPVVVLLHHVHREQWPILFGRLFGALGWWLESRFAPWVYRHCPYVTVSAATADELGRQGIDLERITVVPNGLDPRPPVRSTRSEQPRLVTLGRLVPHKRVEHAIDALARLRDRWPDMTLDVVGEGWWDEQLRAYARECGVEHQVRFHGFVDEQTKHELLAQAWVHLCPSVKEGWGIVVIEAAGHGVPTVAYRSAGGLRESVLDGHTGLLVEDQDELTGAVARLLAETETRQTLGAAAQRRAADFTWQATTAAFGAVLARSAAASHRPSTPRSVERGPSCYRPVATPRDGVDTA